MGALAFYNTLAFTHSRSRHLDSQRRERVLVHLGVVAPPLGGLALRRVEDGGGRRLAQALEGMTGERRPAGIS